MQMIFNALDSSTDEGRLTGRILTLENIFLTVLKTTNFLGDSFEIDPFLHTLYFGTHKIFIIFSARISEIYRNFNLEPLFSPSLPKPTIKRIKKRVNVRQN